MSFMDEYNALKKKRKEEEEEEKKYTGDSSFLQEYKKLKEEREKDESTVGTLGGDDDIAPVSTGKGIFDEGTKWYQGWVDKGALSDGYQFGDISKIVLGTMNDNRETVTKAVIDATENLMDAGAHAVGTVGRIFSKDFQQKAYDFAAKDNFKSQETSEKIMRGLNWIDPIGVATNLLVDDTEEASVMGDKADGLLESAAHMVGSAALGRLGVPTWLTQGINAFSPAFEEAKEAGATDTQATINAGVAAVAEVLIEKLSGGIVSGTGADDLFLKPIVNKISNKFMAGLVKFTGKAALEGVEEVATEFATDVSKRWTYDKDVFKDEDTFDRYVTTFLSGALMGIGGQAVEVSQAKSVGRNYSTGMTDAEFSVIDKLVNDEVAKREADGKKVSQYQKNKIENEIIEKMEKGTIKVEEIESILGGESYKTYDTEWNKLKSTDDWKALEKAESDEKMLPSLRQKYDELHKMKRGDMTGEQIDQETSLKSQIEAIQSNKSSDLFAKLAPEANRVKQLRDQMRGEVSTMVKDSRLAESYRELERSKQKFTADATKYTNENAKKTVQNIIDSGLGDNSNAFHAKVELLAKVSADTGVTYTLTENSKIVGTEHYQEGYTTHGFIDDNGNIVINMDSKRLLATTAGHEVGHEFQKAGLDKKYSAILRDYCITKEGLAAYNKRIEDAKIAYKNKTNTTAEIEVANDLLGEYIFNDENFIKHLSTADRNVFQKVYDTIKYMCKIATAGSEEKRLLEKAKHEFEKAWREISKVKADAKTETKSDNNIQYSLENSKKSKYNKHSKYSETESLFLGWERGSAKVGDVKAFIRYGKTHYYEKTENGCVELSKAQYNERNGVDVEDIKRRAKREISETVDYDEYPGRGLLGHSDSNRDPGKNASVFGQAIREELQYDSAGNLPSVPGYDSRNDLNQSEYNEEASDDSGASFITFSNDYAAIRNHLKEGDTAQETEILYSLSKDSEFSDKAISKNEEKLLVDAEAMFAAKELRNRIASRMNDIKDRGLVALPDDIEGNTYIANSSYDGTEENTTICPRSLASEAFVDAVSEYLGRPLTVEEQIYISQDHQGRSMTPECTYCYVATDRKAYRAFLGKYFNQRTAVIDKLKSDPNADTSRSGELYKDFLNGRKDTNPMYNRFKMWVDTYKSGKPMVDASHLANINKLMGDINSEFGAELKPQIVDAMKYAQSASWAKKRVNYVAYNGHILNWKQDRINKLNSHYGLRMYSFSDFHPAFVLENMQMITDASVRGLKMLGYTKDTDFVEIFAPSGMNINISTFGFETDGNVYENNIIGAEWEKAKSLREKYPNVGITFVATNDTLVNWALEQEWIDVVIPYHLVRTGAEVAKAFGYTNYTSESSDTKTKEWTKGDKKYIAPTEHNNDIDTYFKALEENHLNPRFERFKDNPNYMKLVNECRQSASDSKPVQPVFNEDAAMVALAKLEANGYYQPIGGSVDRMYEIAAQVAEDMENNIAPTKYSMSKIDAQYQEALDNGDMETLEKLVDESAKAAGYDIKAYHGTDYKITVFDKSKSRTNTGKAFYGVGLYFSTSRIDAENYGSIVKPVYLRPGKVLDLDSDTWTYDLGLEERAERVEVEKVKIEPLKNGFVNIHYTTKDAPTVWKSMSNISPMQIAGDKTGKTFVEHKLNPESLILPRDVKNLAELARAHGFTSLKGSGSNIGDTGTEYVVFDSEQIKSADPVTYDDYGNVIPLSERFNRENEDIRYSVSKDSVEYSPYREAPADFGYRDPLDDFAPVRDDVAPVAKTEQMDVPVVDEKELFPDDAASVSVELDALTERKANLEDMMQEAIEAEDLEAFTKINEEYDSVMTRLDAINAEENERISSIDDSDAPPVRSSYADRLEDSVRLTGKTTAEIAKEVKTSLGVPNKQMYDVHKLIEAYSNGEISSREQLYWELKEKFGTQEEKVTDERTKEVKSYLHSYRISVSDSIKDEIADFGDLQRRNRGRIIFSRQGVPVDIAYQEMAVSFPEFFPEDITNPTDQLMQILDVANSEAQTIHTIEIDDETLLGVAQDIMDYVGDVKYVQDQRFANQSSKAAFDALMEDMDDIAPVAGQTAQKPKAKTSEPSTVREKIDAKIESAKTELSNNQQNKAQSWNEYTEEINRLQYEYDSKQNKNSIAANNLLRRIEKLKRMRSDVAADYSKRISDIEKRLEKFQSPEYKRSEQRRAKYDEYKDLWENMLGDTSTWKDKALGLSYKTTTMRRFLRDVVRDEYGKKDFVKADAIYDELETKYDHNEALLKRESGKLKESFFDMKLNKVEDTYAHMLGEFRHNPETTLTQEVVEDYYNKHKKQIDTAKVDHAIEEARNTFDSLIVRVNEVLREQGMKEIPYRKGYFPHFQNPKQGFLGKLLNWKKVDTEIPTSIAGLTENFNPERSWQRFNKQRKGDTTDYSLYQGLDTYIHGALDWIYHIEDIQKRRALENYIRSMYVEEEIKAKIEAIRANETYDADEAQAQIELVLAKAANPLNNLVTELRRRTNTLTNKKASGDRKWEEDTSRKIYSTMTNLNNRINANMVVGSFSSALTNFIPIVQSWHQVSPFYTVRGLGDFVRSAVKDDGMIAKSDFLTNRLVEEEKLYQTGWDKVSDKAAMMMNVIDNITSQTVWRSKYLQNKHEGMSEAQAIKDADQFAKNLIAGRSRGNMPTIFDEKNPFTKIFTAFQLEVANQYGFMFKDTPQDSKNAVRLVKGYATAFLGAYLYNALYSSITGRDAAFDPIGIIEDLLRDLGFGDDEEKKETKEVILNLADNVVDEMPFISGLTGGGRIPLSSAMPYSGDSTPFKNFLTDVEEFGEGGLKDVMKEMLNPLYYLVMPVGGGQIKKTVEGLSMFSDDHPVAGSYTDSGALRFPVEDTFGNKVKAALFGQWSSQNARDYIEQGRKPLSEKQLQEYIDLEMPIQDYWEYHDGLKKQETLADKFDYIAGLDISVEQKNIMINNIVDRKDQVDMTNYDEIGDYEEFDFYSKNTEKYEFLQKYGVSYQEYTSSEEAKENYDSIYSWTKNYPNKVTVSEVITDNVIEYRGYTSALDNIRADKDENGKSISGSAKEKKKNYIFNLDLEDGQKYILFKSEYPADDTYNYEIIDYLNNRDDVSYSEMITILKELGFTIGADGKTITWD